MGIPLPETPLSPMKWKDEDLPALRELENVIFSIWSKNRNMADYDVSRAYEAAYQCQRARNRGQEPKPHSLSGLDGEMFESLCVICEKLLSTGPNPMSGDRAGDLQPVQSERLADYLRDLHRSVRRHTKDGGRQGYLIFLSTFFR